MAIKVGGTEVVDNNRQLKNIASVDATTVAALGTAGVGGGNSFDATISGSVADGKPMVLNTNGTVAAVTQTAVALDPPQDSHHVDIDTSSVYSHSLAYHPVHERTVVVWRDANDSNKVKFGIIDSGDGTSALTTSGLGTTTSSNHDAYEVDIAYDPRSQNFVACWRGTNNQGYAVALSIAATGGTITFGSVQNFTGQSIAEPKIACGGPSSNSFGNAIIIWRNQASGSQGNIILYNVESNRNMTQRTGGQFATGVTLESDIEYDPDTDRFLIAYRNNDNNEYGEVKIVEVTSNTAVGSSSISTSGATVFDTNTSDDNKLVYDTTNNKMIVFWQREHGGGQSNNRWYARVGTITGGSTNTISFGTAVEVTSTNSSAGTGMIVAVHDPDANKIVVIYRLDDSTQYAIVKTATISGTSITFSNNEDSNASLSVAISRLSINLAYDTKNNCVIYAWTKNAGNDGAVAGKIKTQTLTTNLTASNYIGIADAAYTDGQTATVQTMGAIDDAQSGLTVGSKHYVQPDGTLATSASSPSVEAGLAVSATKLLVKG